MSSEFISKIEELKDVKPRPEWVVLTKAKILGQEYASSENHSPHLWGIFGWRPAERGWRSITAMSVSMAVLLAVFIGAQSALPGDPLYSLKRMTEKGQTAFVSTREKPKANIELASKRLEELGQIAKNNQSRRLAPAISEFQANVASVTKDLVAMSSTSSDMTAVKGIVQAAQELEENKRKVEAMGIVVGGTDELDSAILKLVEREISAMNANDLTENQQKTLDQAKEDLKAGDYSSALEKILLMMP